MVKPAHLAIICVCVAMLLLGVSGVWRLRVGPHHAPNRVVSAAVAEAERHGWKNARVIDEKLSRNVWTIELQRQPLVYGGHATVVVSQTGEILSYSPGL